MDDLLARHGTLLLDMDGTLLDLAYDNHFWLETLPQALAQARGESVDWAKQAVNAMIDAERGSLNWYCLDFWSERLELDVLALKKTCAEPIRFIAGAEAFLRRARTAGYRLLLVTNSSPALLRLKDEVTAISELVDVAYSSGDFGAPKESQTFWQRFAQRIALDRRDSLLLDDSASVLHAGRVFGLGGVLGIRQPDSGRAPNSLDHWPSVDGVHELLND